LRGVLHCRQMMDADSTREHRDESAVLVPKEVRVEEAIHPGVRISMTSTPDPGLTKPGHSRAMLIASSRLEADFRCPAAIRSDWSA
jgi:hypothetical protein